MIAVLLFGWGAISFHNLPVEAYPDVANNYVTVITQWPGRAAEEVEQQVTVPLEIALAGIPHMTHLRSTSLAGLSIVTMIFDDDSSERLEPGKGAGAAVAGDAADGAAAADWNGLEPGGADLLVHAASTNPAYDTMQLKSLRTGRWRSSSAACRAWWMFRVLAGSRASTR